MNTIQEHNVAQYFTVIKQSGILKVKQPDGSVEERPYARDIIVVNVSYDFPKNYIEEIKEVFNVSRAVEWDYGDAVRYTREFLPYTKSHADFIHRAYRELVHKADENLLPVFDNVLLVFYK